MDNNQPLIITIKAALILSILFFSNNIFAQINVTDWRKLKIQTFHKKIENTWRSELSVSLAVFGGTKNQLSHIYEAVNTATKKVGNIWIYLGTLDKKTNELSVIIASRYTEKKRISLADYENFKSFKIKLFKELVRDVADFSEVKTGRIIGYIYSAPEKDLSNINPENIHQCDKLAGSVWDEQGVTKGLIDKEVNIPEALAACKAAVKTNPENKRYRYQYARTLYLNKNYKGAEIWAKKGTIGVTNPYSMSLYLLGKLKSGVNKSTRDIEAACDLFFNAASTGSTIANFTSAYCHSGGLIKESQMAFARQRYEYAAKKNFAGAQYALGLYFQFGIGGKLDKEKAAYFYKKAKTNGIVKSKGRINVLKSEGFNGNLYFELDRLIPKIKKGDMVSAKRLSEIYKELPKSHENTQKLSYWYSLALLKSAKLSNPNALYELAKGRLPINSNTKILEESLQNYKSAAAKNHGLANFDLGMFNYYGRYGFKENQLIGLALFKKAASLGVNYANKELADIYFSGTEKISKNIDLAIHHYSKLTDSIKKKSYFNLADAYSQRGGVEDLKKAVELYHKYENSLGWFTNQKVQKKLYNIYKNGIGVKASASMAKHYYELINAAAIAREKRQKERDGILKKRGYDFVRIEGLEVEFDKAYVAEQKYHNLIKYELMQDGFFEGLRADALSDKRIKTDLISPREDVRVYCYSYRAKYNSEKTTRDCLISKDDVLVGFKFDRSRTGCESECDWGIEQAREIIAAGFKRFSKKNTDTSVKYIYLYHNLKMKLHLWNNSRITKTTTKGYTTLYNEHWFSQKAALCLYPKKLEALLSSLGTNGEYACGLPNTK